MIEPVGRKPDPPSPHPLAYRPPMSVHMFRARLGRMHGEDSGASPDALDLLLEPACHDVDAASTSQREKDAGSAKAADTRGILTQVVHQTQNVAGVFSGVGDFVSAIMSQSPPTKSASDGDAASEAGMRSARLRYFRLDEKDKLIEEDYDNLPGSTAPDWAQLPEFTFKGNDPRATSDVYWIF